MATDAQLLPWQLQGHTAARTELRSLKARALLFAGPDGVGRRPLARWYAAWLNCFAGETEPCGRCESCAMFRSGHPDLLEIAPAATTATGRLNRRPEIRIGQLRGRSGQDGEPLSDWLERSPLFRCRVGVIDSADRLTRAAANSFLKILEEPPSRARLVLIAPDARSLLPTVASRVVPLRLGTVDTSGLEPAGHPAHRLGTPGPLFEAAANAAQWEEAEQLTEDFLAGLQGGLRQAFAAAAALQEALLGPAGHTVVQLLRSRLLDELPPGAAARAFDALERAGEQLAAYASPAVTLQLLVLELRRLY